MAWLTLGAKNLMPSPFAFGGPDGWVLAPSLTVTANTTVAPDKTTTGDTIDEASSGDNFAAVRDDIVYTGDGTKHASVYLNAGVATPTQTDVSVYDTDATTHRHRVRLTWPSTISTAVGSGERSVTTVDASGSNTWRWVRFTAPSVVAANDNGLWVYPSGGGIMEVCDIRVWGAYTSDDVQDVPVAARGAAVRYAEVGARAIAWDGTARSSVRTRKRVWEGITTRPLSDTEQVALYDLLVSAPPLVAWGDMVRHVYTEVHASDIREVYVATNASGEYRRALQFTLREV